MVDDLLFIIVDLFCGAGGTTTGFEKAVLPSAIYSKYYVGPDFSETGFQKLAKVIACVNHDPIAIRSHWVNHPEVKHFEEDIRTLDLTALIELVACYRVKYPYAKLILWASLECTNFSKAKGGQPRIADSRTLAEHLQRYIQALNPDYIQIENVVEFRSWGPMRIKCKQQHNDRSDLYLIKDKKTHQYVYGWEPLSKKNGRDWMRWCKEIDAMGYHNEWKELNSANFGAYTSRNRLFGVFAKHNLPIAWPEATHAKSPSKDSMYGDLQKWKAVKDVLDFTDEGESIFNRKKPLCDKTLERIYAGLVKYVSKGDTSFISKYFSGKPQSKNISVEGPAGTVTCIDSQALVKATFLLKYNSTNRDGRHVPPSVDLPSPVISCQGRLGLIQGEFLDVVYGNGYPSDIEKPAPTLRTKDGLALVQYIANPSYGGHSTSVDVPCPVIVARQDKAPLYLVQAQAGQIAIAIFEGDSPIMIKIKQFMCVYGLVDIKMRMLRVNELLKIQGFPKGYCLEGNQADQKKFIGNSVVPQVVKAWTEALAIRIINNTLKKAA